MNDYRSEKVLNKDAEVRSEMDWLGRVDIPREAYYGPQTSRTLAYLSQPNHEAFKAVARSLAMIKRAVAQNAVDMSLISSEHGDAIVVAAAEVADGALDEHIVIDWLQIGSGTSTNMNVNEVIANRANELIGAVHGADGWVHAIDHVNLGQSSNDVFPASVHIAVLLEWTNSLLPALDGLISSLEQKSRDFVDVVKMGRTHMFDALPVTLGQELSGYAHQLLQARGGLVVAVEALDELPLGGTAVGTGLNSIPGLTSKVIEQLGAEVGRELREATNHFEAQGGRDRLVSVHSACRVLAVALTKMGNDIRLMASGPRGSIGEIAIRSMPPNSSIMPAKGTPVIVEILTQAAAQVVGNDVAVSIGGMSGQFELNAYAPLIAKNVLESFDLLSRSMAMFAESCISTIEPNEDRCRELAESSLAISARLTPILGYDDVAKFVSEAILQNSSLTDVILKSGRFTKEELGTLLDVSDMTRMPT